MAAFPSLEEVKRLSEATGTAGACPREAIGGVATLEEAREGDLAFLSSAKYNRQLSTTQASVVLVPEDCPAAPGPGQLFLKTPRPSLAMARICELIARSLWPAPEPGVHPTALVAPEADIDPSSSVGPFCIVEPGARVGPSVRIEAHGYVGPEVRIGAESWLSPRVTLLRDTVVGRRCRLHPGVVLGADGFGYERVDAGYVKSPQIGSARIGDDVEIGANTTIDRGRLGPTAVGEGTKIDNQVMIGHNCRIGRRCILCGQVGLAGSTIVEDDAVLGARAATAGHLTVGAGAQIAAAALVYRSVPPGKAIGGWPATDLNAHLKISALVRRLPELFKRLQRLEEQFGETAASTTGRP